MVSRYAIKFILIFIGCLSSATNVLASVCVNAFPDALQTHSSNNNHAIEFECGAKIINNPDLSLGGKKVIPEDQCPFTCDTEDCTAETPVSSLNIGAFQASDKSDGNVTISSGQSQTLGTGGETDYNRITVEDNATLTFDAQGGNPTYKMVRLTLNDDTTMQLAPGDYWIDTIVVRSQNIQVSVLGEGTARIYLNKGMTIEKSAQWNIDAADPDVGKKLFIYSYTNLTIEDSATLNGLLYAEGSITVGTDINVSGGLLANNITLNENATVTFNSSYVSGADFTGICANTADCQARYQNAAQTFNADVDFLCGAQVLQNPDATLPASIINAVDDSSCPATCTGNYCVTAGVPSTELDAGTFVASSKVNGNLTVPTSGTVTTGQNGETDFDIIELQSGATLTFSPHLLKTEYKIDTLILGDDTTLNLEPGNYWIKNITVGNRVTINVLNQGTARFVIDRPATFGQQAKLNDQQSASNLLVYAYNALTFNQQLEGAFVLYGEKQVDVGQNSVLFGAISAQQIVLRANTTITYDSAAINALDFGFLCYEVNATHFEITHGNSGALCIEHPVTISAEDGNQVSTGYVGTIVLDTGSGKGTWSLSSGRGTFSDSVSNDGLATYTYAAADLGVATFTLDYYEGPRTIDIEVYDITNSTIRDDDKDGSITFADLGFLLTAEPISTPPIPVPQSYNESQTAGIADTIYLTAYGLDADNQVCGVVNSYTGTKSIKAWNTYVNPSTGTLTPDINNETVGGSEVQATTHSIQFTNGLASFTTKYRDVGQIMLSVKDDSINPNYLGDTANYVVKPAKLDVVVTNNPGATSETGTKFIAAGENFTATVTVKDNDGNITPNFGNESSPESVKVFSSTLVLPVDGRNGSNDDGAIGNGDSFVKTQPGIFEATQLSFDEVGIIKLSASIASGSYLGAGDVVGDETSEVGKFVPFDFDVSANTPVFDAGCVVGAFTYFDQNFLYSISPQITVTARAVGGTTTQNYKGNFWRITPTLLNPTYDSNSASATLNSTDAVADVTLNDLGNGTGTYTFGDGGGLSFERVQGQLISPFDAELELSVTVLDEDGVAYTNNPYQYGGTGDTEGISFSGGKRFQQGRIQLSQAAGSELLPLSVPFEVQYYDGTSFLTNTLDSCTPFTNPAHVLLTPEPSQLTTTPQVTTFINGFGLLVLTTPTPAGITGQVDIEVDLGAAAANLPYLQFDWPYDGAADGVYDDNPRARATFGIDKGKDEIIYLREIY